MHHPSAKDIDGKGLLQDVPILKLSSFDLRREEVILTYMLCSTLGKGDGLEMRDTLGS